MIRVLKQLCSQGSENNLRHVFVLVILLLFLYRPANGALIRSNGSGNWTTGSTWVGGVVPGCGDSIVVMPGHSISISSNISLEACTAPIPIALSGTLVFSNGRKMSLPCNSRIYLFTGGVVTVTGGGASNVIEICAVTAWSSTSGNFTGPSCLPVTLPGCATVLPVKLKSFSSANCGENVCHNWITATERDAHSFCLEKSRDGLQFIQVACVFSKAPGGNSQTDISYSYEESNASKGTSYYRLKQINTDGSFEYYSLTAVEVLNHETQGFKIQPNPNNGAMRLTLDKIVPFFEVLILDYTGKILQRMLGENTDRIDLRMDQPGLYFCQLSAGESSFTARLIVE